MFVKIKNGGVEVYPYTIGMLYKDNPNVSFPKNMPEKVLNEYGCFRVKGTKKPKGDLVVEGTPKLVKGVWTQQWETRKFNRRELVSYKDRTKNSISAYRYNVETNHPTLDTSRQGRKAIGEILYSLNLNPNMVINFKNKDGSWSKVNKSTAEKMMSDIFNWVQGCFDRELQLYSMVDSAEDKEQIDSIDITVGWPE